MFRGLKIKFLIIFSIIAVIVLLTFIGIFYMANKNMIDDRGKVEILAAEKYYVALEEQDIRVIKATLNVFIEEPEYKEFFIAGDRDGLFNSTNPLFQKLKEEFGITHFYFHSLDGTTFLRVHNKDIFGDKVDRITFKKTEEAQEVSDGVELGRTAFALRVVAPYYKDGVLIGYVEMGQEINNFIRFIKEREYKELAVFVSKVKLDKDNWKSVKSVAGVRNNWNDFRSYVKIDSTFNEENFSSEFQAECFNEEKINAIIKGKETIFFKGYEEKNKFLTCSAFPIKDASEQVVGAVFSVSDLTKTKKDTGVVAFNMIGAFIVLISILFLIYLFLINRFFIKPVNILNEMAVKVANRDFSVRSVIDSNDEIGDLNRSFNKMAKELDASTAEIENKIEDRTKTLEDLNRYMAGREIKMIELKEEIEELKSKSK